ncbi:hypothetical protein Tco_0233050 [Tanacetum coccineum]
MCERERAESASTQCATHTHSRVETISDTHTQIIVYSETCGMEKMDEWDASGVVFVRYHSIDVEDDGKGGWDGFICSGWGRLMGVLDGCWGVMRAVLYTFTNGEERAGIQIEQIGIGWRFSGVEIYVECVDDVDIGVVDEWCEWFGKLGLDIDDRCDVLRILFMRTHIPLPINILELEQLVDARRDQLSMLFFSRHHYVFLVSCTDRKRDLHCELSSCPSIWWNDLFLNQLPDIIVH